MVSLKKQMNSRKFILIPTIPLGNIENNQLENFFEILRSDSRRIFIIRFLLILKQQLFDQLLLPPSL